MTTEFKARLVALSKKYKGYEYPLSKDACVIGRNDDCDIPMQTQMMSRRHAEFLYTEQGLLLKDLGSHNGTFVNGEKIDERIVSSQDKIQIGGVRFKLSMGDAGHSEHQDDAELTPPLETLLPSGVHPHESANPQVIAPLHPQELVSHHDDVQPIAEGEVVESGKNIINSGMFMGIMGLALVLGVLVLFNAMKEVEKPAKVIKLRAGEERVISTETFMKGEAASLRVSNPSLMQAKFYTAPNGNVVKWIVEIRTLNWGEVLLSLYNANGEVMEKLKIIIEGQLVRDSETIIGELMTDDMKSARAAEYFAKGKTAEESSPRDALINFRLAYDITNKMETKPDFYTDLTTCLEANQDRVNQQIKQLWEQFYFNIKNAENLQALNELKNIMNFVHDQRSMEYQRALLYFNKLEKSLRKAEK